MTEPESGQVSQDAGGVGAGANEAGDVLAVRLLTAQRLIALAADPDEKVRLQLRFIAICTALKLPGASRARGARRLDRLMADARRAQNTKLTSIRLR
jgi:hypothetical protein